MSFFISITEFGSYLLFSFLVGHVALQFVPHANKPERTIAKPVLLLSTLGIIILSLGPVVQVISYFQESVGLALAIRAVLMDFQVGKAWIFIGFMSTFLWITLVINGSKYIQALWLFLMIIAVGYSSHVASLSFWSGLVSHTVHLLLVTLWTGILIHVAWFSKGQPNWSKFLRWFTPLAFGCFIIIIASGLFLMLYVVEPKDYVKAWVLPYGQILFLKHISIIPVIVFAFINGVLTRKSLKNSSFNPRPWIRGESILLFIVFYITGILGTLSPPHEVEFTVKSEGASKWVEWLIGKEVLSTVQIGLTMSFQTVLLIIASFLFLILILFSFKMVRPIIAVVFGVSFIIALYFGLMFSLSM
jgi:copper resistance protein D